MFYLKQITSSILIGTVVAGLMAATAGAQALPRVEFKSSTSGMCIDVYGGQAKAGTPVGTYPCSRTDKAEQFAPQTGNLYFSGAGSNSLCVGESGGKVELIKCAAADMNFKYFNSKFTLMGLYFGQDSYLTSSATTGRFSPMTIRVNKTASTAQKFDVLSL